MMTGTQNRYCLQRYLLMTLDPVPIGTGGYRLGRVDNSIVREPGTRVPKIPGTSLHGAARSYAAQLYGTPEAAGQSHDEIERPDYNPVTYTFGYIKRIRDSGGAEETRAYSGVVNIFDAHIVLFPVHSMVGPLWVSTLERLGNAGFTVTNNVHKQRKETQNQPDTAADSQDHLEEPANGKAFLTWERRDPLNLGWLMVETAGKVTVEPPSCWNGDSRWKAIETRIVIVNESLFGHIVNSNLEVRTSVSIDPKRGAAKEKALFTYEAIPRATFLTVEVVLDDYRGQFPSKTNLERLKQNLEDKLSQNNLKPEERKHLKEEKAMIELELNHISNLNTAEAKRWNTPLDVVKAGLRMIEWLGVGGMGTRGFGRLAIVGEPVERSFSRDEQPEEICSRNQTEEART